MTSDVTVAQPSLVDRAARINGIAVILFLLGAIGLPTLIVELAPGRKWEMMALTSRMIVFFGFCFFISWLVTRNRSELAKARGRVAVATLAFVLGCALLIAALVGKYRVAQFMETARAQQESYGARLSDAEQRLSEFDLSLLLTPEALGTPGGVAKGSETVGRFRELLRERGAVVREQTASSLNLIAEVPGDSGDELRRTVAPLVSSRAKHYALIDQALGEQATATQAVLDWVQANPGSFSLRDGVVVFKSQEQENQLRKLFAGVALARKSVEVATNDAAADESRAQEVAQRLRKEASSETTK